MDGLLRSIHENLVSIADRAGKGGLADQCGQSDQQQQQSLQHRAIASPRFSDPSSPDSNDFAKVANATVCREHFLFIHVYCNRA